MFDCRLVVGFMETRGGLPADQFRSRAKPLAGSPLRRPRIRPNLRHESAEERARDGTVAATGRVPEIEDQPIRFPQRVEAPRPIPDPVIQEPRGERGLGSGSLRNTQTGSGTPWSATCHAPRADLPVGDTVCSIKYAVSSTENLLRRVKADHPHAQTDQACLHPASRRPDRGTDP